MTTIQNFIERAMQSDEVLSVIIAAGLSILGWLTLRIFTGRARVAWAFSHQHVFYLNSLDPPILAYTREIWVQNVGKAIAEDVEIIFPSKPPHFEVWPKRSYSEINCPDGGFVIKLDNLNTREHLTISIFQAHTSPADFINIRWKGGVGKQIPMGPQQLFPRWFQLTVVTLLYIGVFSSLYFISRLF